MTRPFPKKLRPVLLALMALLGAGGVSEATAACTYSISPTSRTHGYGAATNSVSVTASSGLCAWTVANTNAWITVISATSGTGSGTVLYTVAANPSPIGRTGLVVIAQKNFTVRQQGTVCAYSISPTNRTHGYGAATNFVSVTAPSGCPWVALNTNDWITITSPTSGMGDGVVNYVVAANPSASERTGVVLLAGQPFTLTQRATPCLISISPASRTHGYGASTGMVSVTTAVGCPWVVI
ncbi:MAG TPA: BACON domain-containing carbohydrate-binding protein, partial [Candidatus Binatia bacterium]|nr:BACON domain-containing carbohydrate-binding protein [Candidatus Binatia bacterium]